ncbi:MAG: sulfatase-like hydrolase/transferase [Oscillospiraceae bacterium]|nr:sulfatase-like hydrolase/transferase [Oscillospiraceae bacterium]
MTFLSLLKGHLACARKCNAFLYYLSLILYLELVFRISLGNGIFDAGLVFMPIYSGAAACLFTVLTRVFRTSVNRVLTWVITITLCLYFSIQYMFITILTVPFSFRSIGLANQAVDFFSIVMRALNVHFPIVILLLLPVAPMIVFRRHLNYDRLGWKVCGVFAAVLAVAHGTALLLLLFVDRDELYAPHRLYYQVDAAEQINRTFGLLAGTRIDIQRLVFGHTDVIIEEDPDIPDESDPPAPPSPLQSATPSETPPPSSGAGTPTPPATPIVYGDNVLDIDFEALAAATDNQTLKDMHKYFADRQPTAQNQYTGLFHGKNLIFIVAEGFCQLAVREDLTPTLYKMANSSFVFTNYYTPHMFSTVGGEMQALLGLIPFQETINLWHTEKPVFPYAIGNALKKEGYRAKAFHNHTYSYYHRDQTRGTLGFEDYMGRDNGLELLMSFDHWPPSDIDMIEAIDDMIIGQDTPMVTYILTVSGHSNYDDSYIASKNMHLVEHLPYSVPLRGYLASQIELDRALALLLQKLEASGELADTVIALVGDHHPYCFTLEELNEISPTPRDHLEIQQSTFILYNSETPVTVIDKLSTQIDVLPTILNLFGVPFDSRLIIGQDILSDAEGLVMFSETCWISPLGRYEKKTFTPNEGAYVPEGYVKQMNRSVANKYSLSKLLMKEDYYRLVLGG